MNNGIIAATFSGKPIYNCDTSNRVPNYHIIYPNIPTKTSTIWENAFEYVLQSITIPWVISYQTNPKQITEDIEIQEVPRDSTGSAGYLTLEITPCCISDHIHFFLLYGKDGELAVKNVIKTNENGLQDLLIFAERLEPIENIEKNYSMTFALDWKLS